MTLRSRSLAALALAALAAACAPATPPNGFGSTGSGAGSASSSSGGQGGDDPIIIGGGGSGGDGGGLDGCAETSAEATLVPVNMFLTVDKSGSMGDNNKWNNAKAAFISFFQDPGAGNMRVALRFWPDNGCDGTSCNVGVCSQPQVDVGALSDQAHAQALIDAFNSKSPSGGTPMSAALGGATKWAADYTASTNGSEKVVVVLLTDGEPNGCDENINNIAALAEDAYQSAGVLTFAVGLAGSNQTDMNTIAMSGQTTQGFFIGNGNAQADLLAALKQIQKTTVACEFQMPQPGPGQVVDPTRVNVKYTPNGGSSVVLGQVPNAGACTDQTGGWYYDDPNQPHSIKLCPSTCATVQADQGSKMEIVVGCTTQPA